MGQHQILVIPNTFVTEGPKGIICLAHGGQYIQHLRKVYLVPPQTQPQQQLQGGVNCNSSLMFMLDGLHLHTPSHLHTESLPTKFNT